MQALGTRSLQLATAELFAHYQNEPLIALSQKLTGRTRTCISYRVGAFSARSDGSCKYSKANISCLKSGYCYSTLVTRQGQSSITSSSRDFIIVDSNSEGNAEFVPPEENIALDIEQGHGHAGKVSQGGPFPYLKKLWATYLQHGRLATTKLQSFGIAGLLSYGLFNTVYYLGAFMFVWLYVSPSPGGLGYRAAAERFLKILVMVWAGSQISKLPRACGALVFAPFVDRGLNWLTENFSFKSRTQAFGWVVGACLILAVLVFILITCLWA